MRNRLLVGLSGFFLLGVSSGCPEEVLAEVAPLISVGDPFDGEASICEQGESANARDANCGYGYGDVPVGEGRFLKVTIDNPSPVKLQIFSIVFEGDPAFSLEADPTNGGSQVHGIESDATFENYDKGTIDPLILTVRYIPQVAGENQRATLRIISDGVNVGLNETDEFDVGTSSLPSVLEIELNGNAIDTGRPEIRIEPAECDFGNVGVGVTAYCDVSVHNDGVKDLQILSTDWDDATTWGFDKIFFSDTILALPAFIAPGTAMSVRFTATPETPALARNEFYFTSNDPLIPESKVDLKVTGAEAPTAIARVKSVNGVPNNTASPTIKPLDDVVLTGEDSVASATNLVIDSYQWEIVQNEDFLNSGSSVQLSNPTGETTGFEFNSAQGNVSGLDVAGTYTVRLTVTDSGGLVSSNDAKVVLSAIPQEALHIQLTWDSNANDLDLHVVKDGGAYCEPTSCYYSNCKSNASGYPEWDGAAGRSAGDPVLDIDDLDGYGPENVNIDAPVDASYKIMVHNYQLDELTGATLKIYVNGALLYEDYREMQATDDQWEVAEVAWANGAATVFPVNLYEEESTCGSGFSF